jgi:hypothetical protein
MFGVWCDVLMYNVLCNDHKCNLKTLISELDNANQRTERIGIGRGWAMYIIR